MTSETCGDIVLLGGASGVGKSRAAAQLARETGAFIVEFDDVVGALEAMTSPATHPDLHHFAEAEAEAESETEAESGATPGAEAERTAHRTPDRVLELQIATARALEPAVLGVVRNRLTVEGPAVVEGDYLTPAVAAEAVAEGSATGRRVCAVFLHEADADRITANYAEREPAAGPQPERAEISARYSHWLADQARTYGLPVVTARPWDSLPDRVRTALRPHTASAHVGR